MNGFDIEKYKSEVNRLGLVAFEEKETLEYQIAIEKLKSYFIRFYGLYLYEVFNLNIGEHSNTQEKIDSCLDYALNNYNRILDNKVNNYNPNNAISIDLPFFSYIIKDFQIGGKKKAAKDKIITIYGGINPELDDHEIALLLKLQRLYDNLENEKKSFFQIATTVLKIPENELRKIWSKKKFITSNIVSNSSNHSSSEKSTINENYNLSIDKREIILLKKLNGLYDALDGGKKDFYKNAAIIFEKSEKEVEKIWKKYKKSLPVSLDASYNSENPDEALLNCIDSGVNIEKQFEETDYVKEHLLILNRIYHDSFMEKHKIAFPPHFTNSLIIGWVKSYQKTNISFDKTVETQWDLINITYKRKCYSEEEYQCISDWIYDWFEETRKQILCKEIAERIHMSPSNFTKVCNQTIELIKKYESNL